MPTIDSRALVILCSALAGAVLGVVLFRWQPAGLGSMNPLAVLAFTSLGASGGCLWVDASST